ncbi:MAG: aspartate kinase [Gemmatimonadaceae bacterium]|nr:aspartate kinase [Gemmatimonadaceae bacterium]
MLVCKFGGTSVADAEAIRRLVAIVRGRLARQPIVVVSALSGTTNDLLAIAEQARAGQLIVALATVEALRTRHLAVVQALAFDAATAADLAADVSALFDELAHLAEALSVLAHATDRAIDAVASLGEQLSAPIVAAALRAGGVAAQSVDAREVLITDATFGRAEPQPERIAEAARRVLSPLVREGTVPVLGGFVGGTVEGTVTTLGRGGSDYSASLIGAALDAEAIEIWTDVDGMLTADPRVVPAARLIPEIRFDEASELATFGAKVLHPNTIAPAVRKAIPVLVLNSRRAAGAGTRITFDAPRHAVRALAGKTNVTLVRVSSPRMLATPGALAAIFAVFAEHGISVDVVATAEVSVSVTIDDDRHLDRAAAALRRLGDVSIERGRGIVAVVGAGLGESTEAVAQAIRALGPIRAQMLSLAASGINLTIVMDGTSVPDAMRRVHASFFEGAA